MKHFIISVAIFLAVGAASVYSDVYTKRVFAQINEKAELLEEIEQVEPQHIYLADGIRDIFTQEKNMLRLFVNKEHIKEIDIHIELLEISAVSGNAEECRRTSVELTNTLQYILDYAKAFN